jgi:murein DD-endopeptidase MepM/ murein hydrolase activator NlpD
VQAPPLRPTASRAGADRTPVALRLSLVATLVALVIAARALTGTTTLADSFQRVPGAMVSATFPATSPDLATRGTGLTAVPGAERAAGGVPRLEPPVEGPLVRGFEEPAGPYGPGHRGVDFAAVPGAPVGSPAAGRVSFAGPVAGTTWLTIEVASGVLVTLGPLRSPRSPTGAAVAVGEHLGTLASGHAASSATAAALHLGLRVDGVYVDPLPWLAGLAPPRLVPLAEPGGPH